MEEKWLRLYEKLVNTDTGFDISLSAKLERTSFVTEILNTYGFEVHQEEAAHVALLGKEPYLTLIGHLDTVFKEGESKARPFQIKENLIYGPGVSDMKGGIITLLATVEAARKNSINSLCVILNVDEELGSKVSRETFYKYANKSVCCLSFEPGGVNGEIVASRKGIVSMNLTVKGKKGHASRLHEGANALVEACRKVDKIYSLNGVFGDLTLNPTIINSGEKSNITPDLCNVYFDVRFSTKSELEDCRKSISEICSDTSIEGTVCEFSFQERRPAMGFHPQMKIALEKTFEKIGRRFELQHSSGGADSAFFYEFNVPTIDGLGITGGRFHSEEEYAFLNSFEPRVALSLEILKYFDQKR
ncbi:MAG TPA: M20/M25/M40 family metallo-hydrolase [Pseudothermotoga sp.]